MNTYVCVEYPKWVDGSLVQNAAEEQAHRASFEDAAAGRGQAALPQSEQTAEMSLEEAMRMLEEEEELAVTESEYAKPDMAAPTAKLARPLSPAAERMRRTRERRRAGQRCVPVVVFDREVEALVKIGLLDEVARNDTHAIGNALGKLMDRLRPEHWPVMPRQ